MRLYRCYACLNDKGTHGVDFATDAADPTCPTCGIAKSDKRAGQFIETLVLLHWEPPHPHPGLAARVGCGHLACDPSVKTGMGGAGHRVTAEPSVVNCPGCKASAVFKAAAASRLDPRFDLPVKAAALAEGITFEKSPADAGHPGE